MVVQHYSVFAQLLDQQFDVDRGWAGCGDSGDTGDNLRDAMVGIWRQLGDGRGDTSQDRGRLIFRLKAAYCVIQTEHDTPRKSWRLGFSHSSL